MLRYVQEHGLQPKPDPSAFFDLWMKTALSAAQLTARPLDTAAAPSPQAGHRPNTKLLLIARRASVRPSAPSLSPCLPSIGCLPAPPSGASPPHQASSNIAPDFGVALTPDECRAYDAPFPSEIYKAGLRALPSMMAVLDAQTELRAWEALKAFDKPFLTCFGERDVLLGHPRIQNKLVSNIAGAAGQPHDRIVAGHFIQETHGPEMARRLVAFLATLPPVRVGAASSGGRRRSKL